jgi:SAM-dependent methyltransferase
MIEPNNPDIDVDDLMHRIAAETGDKQEEWAGIKAHQASGQMVDLLVPEIEMRVHPRVSEDDTYRLSDFVGLHNADFIRAAYGAILKRKPDLDSLGHFLTGLNTGRLSKVDILGRLRYSPEGRQIGLRIQGLKLPFLMHSMFRLPVLGPLCKFGYALARLPRQPENDRRFESTVFTELEGIKRHYNRLAKSFNQLVSGDGFQSLTAETAGVPSGTVSARPERTVRAANDGVEISAQRTEGAAVATGNASLDANFSHRWYMAFEERFRGNRDAIMQRQRCYLPIIRSSTAGSSAAAVLDLGCGRGEWIELLGRNDIVARGVDQNAVMVQRCRDRGLSAETADIYEYLPSIANGSLGAVTAFQVIEHLPPGRVMTLLSESYRTLAKGGVAIFETPNPCNLVVGAANFHADPTHCRPIFPQTAQFMAESVGFTDVSLFFPPAPWPDNPYPAIEEDHPLAASINPLVNLANTHFAASPDFAVIARK